MKKKVVVALGHRALGTTLPEQQIAVKNAAVTIADLIEAGYQVAVSHSNAPQLGMIHTAMNEFAKIHHEFTSAPMSICSAMSQGYIGYDLQNAIRVELLNRGICRQTCTIITQVIVDPYDDAFYTPTKVLGRVMNAEDAEAERKKGNYVVQIPDQGYRRVIASPNPVEIVEIDAIRTLVDNGCVVIACGGGGIPVLQQGHHLKGASALIEKDLTAGKLAEQLDADELIILTAVEKVSLNLGTKDEQLLDTISIEEAKQYMVEGHFGAYNMLPKFRASVAFIEGREGRIARITDAESLAACMAGETGTVIK